MGIGRQFHCPPPCQPRAFDNVPIASMLTPRTLPKPDVSSIVIGTLRLGAFCRYAVSEGEENVSKQWGNLTKRISITGWLWQANLPKRPRGVLDHDAMRSNRKLLRQQQDHDDAGNGSDRCPQTSRRLRVVD
jgi:hypothetical protein